MSTVEAPQIYLKKLVPVLCLPDVFKGHPTASLPPPGHHFDTTLPNGVWCRVEHWPNGTWWLIICGIHRYQLLPERMPRQGWFVYRDGAWHPPFGKPWPIRWWILDSLGHRVLKLFIHDIDTDGDPAPFGSRHELGATTYKTDFMSPAARVKRREDQLRAKYQSKTDVDAILNWRLPVAAVLRRYKPVNMHRVAFLRDIVRARHGIVHKGDLQNIEGQITGFVRDLIWCRSYKSGRRKGDKPEHFDSTIGLLNAQRRKAKRRREELEIEPCVPLHSGSCQ